ncbi:MAG: hypothetical protein J5858_15170 [Lentisphaeria bacterium]|nr:hypothetical protein [Lentisphaeria bacterium]
MNRGKEGNIIFIAECCGAAIVIILILIACVGCATEKLAEGITTKNVSGNGTVVDAHIGINADNKVPEIRSIFVSGDFATTKSGTNAVSYREESSASVWNASSITKKRFLSITLTDAGDVPAAIKAVAEVLKEGEKGKEKREAETAEKSPAQ